MNNIKKQEKIFKYLLNAMHIAKDLHNDEIFDVLYETGNKIADILDKGEEKMTENEGEWIDHSATFWECPDCGHLLEKCCPNCQKEVVLPNRADMRKEGE